MQVRIEILANGVKKVLEVEQVAYLRACVHCRKDFKTADPRKNYCSTKCAVDAANDRKAMR